MNEQVVEERTEVAQASVVEGTLVQANPSKIVPLNYEAAFASYTPQEQQEIIALAESIDVLKTDNVMHYGGTVMKKTFDQCGELLKKERGSEADQSVLAMVSEFSKQSKEAYADFNELIKVKKPNFMQRVFLAIKTGKGWSEVHAQQIQESAITNYDLLMKLKEYEELWLEELTETDEQVTASAESDVETGSLLEKYFIAGKLAEGRIGQQIAEKEAQYQQTGIQRYDYEREELERGYELFSVKMTKLEQTLNMYRMSLAQLGLTKRTVQNLKITISSETEHTMTLVGQQLRNALLAAKPRAVIDGHKAISHLSDDLIKKVCENVGLSAQESEEMIYEAFFNIESAKTAVAALINCCQTIEKVAGEKLPEMKANTAELSKMFDELDEYLNNPLKTLENGVSANASTPAGGNDKLEF